MFKTIKIVCLGIFNIILLLILYNIPIDSSFLNNICLFKAIFGKPCWNCGMTRSFLAILHLDLKNALNYNYNVVVVFPLTIGLYLDFLIKYLRREKKVK